MFRCDGNRKTRCTDKGKKWPDDHAGQERRSGGQCHLAIPGITRVCLSCILSHFFPLGLSILENKSKLTLPFLLKLVIPIGPVSTTLSFCVCARSRPGLDPFHRSTSWPCVPFPPFRPFAPLCVIRLYRFLLNTHFHSPLARAMYVAIRQARVNDKFQDSLYLFLELVRAGVLHGHLWSGRAFSGGPSFGTGTYSTFSRPFAVSFCFSFSLCSVREAE